MVQAMLMTFPPQFRHDGRFPIDLAAPAEAPPPDIPLTPIHDARPLQAAATPADFFERHGFVLLPHVTQVRDWDQEVTSVYAAEVQGLITRHLLPGRKFTPGGGSSLVRRGRGTTNGYAGGVHQDCGLTADDYQQLVGAFASDAAAAGWRYGYDRPEVAGYMMLDFWRPTDMAEPLRHMPLTLCDPSSVDPDDIVPTAVSGIAARPVHQMCLRRHEMQRWYYYPDMTVDEVLVFKLFDCRKSDDIPRLRSAFHTAFSDPTTPDDAQHRQSCEYRTGLYVMNDTNGR